MTEEHLTMNTREINRLEVMNLLKAKKIKQKDAAKRLGLGVRQIKRLWASYKRDGAAGLVSGHRRTPGNHRLSDTLKSNAIALVREYYADFGPTLAQEYLLEQHNVFIGVELLRCLMIKEGLWRARCRKAVAVHQQRERRPHSVNWFN